MSTAIQEEVATTAFDAVGYDPLEYEEVYNDIHAALEGADLPALYSDKAWKYEGCGFRFVGSPAEVERIETILEEFGVRINPAADADDPRRLVTTQPTVFP